MAMQGKFPDIESSSLDYRERFSGEVGQWFLDVQAQHTASALDGLNGESALDVGGGHAQNVSTLVNLGYKTEVLGSSSSCGSLLAEYLERRDVTFSTGSLLDLPYADQSMDVVLSYRMLAHIEDWERHIAELCRVSRRLVIIDFPPARSFNLVSNQLFAIKKRIEKNTRPYRVFNENEITLQFEQYGFNQDYRAGQFFLPMALHRASRSVKISSNSELIADKLMLKRLFASPMITSYRRG